GATAFQVMLATSSAGFGAGNTYFDIVLRGQGPVIQQAMVQQPTFASVWLGNNEVLGYATAGGLMDLDPNTAGFSPFNKDAFALYYSAIWDSLKKVGTTKGITFTVPKVTNAPFFTTLKPYFTHEDNPAIPENVKVPVWGQELDGTSRKLKETEFVLLTASDSLKVGYGQDSLKALHNQFILDEAEIAIITDFTNSYNATITTVAQTNGIPVVDINTFLEKFLPENGGYELNGITLTTEFISGGLFGLDGVHPNVVGYGLLTNEIIPKINEKYGTNLPLVNVNELIGTAK
ncbi:hypothetical protein IT568_05990, partial [bacterium]|nr:hypothetical protein [bacterium]